MVCTLANIVDRFTPGQTYNIGGSSLHSIEELADVVLKVTNANPALVRYHNSEVLTTKHKRVDVSKAVRDLGHRDTFSLEEGMRLTAQWMRTVYKIPGATAPIIAALVK